MAIEDVTNKIKEEAQKLVQQLLSQADAEAQRIENETQREIDDYQKKLRENAEQMIAKERRKALASAEFEGKRLLLDRKTGIVDAVMADVAKEVQKLPAAERRAVLQKLLKEVSNEIDVQKVHINPKDKTTVRDALGGVTVVEQEMLGGVIAESKDGRVRVDMSFEAILEQLREEHLGELSRVLFG